MVDGPVRVFVSYAHDDDAHQAAVRRLWELLRSLGLDAHLDLMYADSVQPWAEWMEQEIAAADFVLVIASPRYRERAAAAGPEHEGRGVWYEARMLRELIYRDKGRESRNRILAVVLPGGSPDQLPQFFTPYTETYFPIRDITEAGLGQLLKVLRREVTVVTPALGVPGGARPLRREVGLDVSVESGRVRTRVVVDGQLAGERDAPVPFGIDRVWRDLDALVAVAAQSLAEQGRRLSAALMDTTVLQAVSSVIAGAANGETVDVVITTDGAGLELPFELMRLADDQVLATAAGVQISRRVRGVSGVAAAPSAGPLKILAAVAAPERTTNPPLDIEAEMQAVVDAVGGLGGAEVTILEVAGLAQITDALRRDAYHILHLSAHGSSSTVELEDEDGNAVQAGAAQLVAALKRAGRPIPLVVLSSCAGAAGAESGLAVTLLRDGADRVLAMQTAVTDQYATDLMGAVYQELAANGGSIGAALAFARGRLYDQATETTRPEYGVPTLFAAAGDPELIDPTVPAVHLRRHTEPPQGVGVRELRMGDLIGRRSQLRITLRALRGDPAITEAYGAVAGVALTGIGGIGKTALAGRALGRLREDRDRPWAIAVHVGAWNPPALVDGVASALPAEAAAQLRASGDEALAVIHHLLQHSRLLIVFDDFEQNLTVGGGEFRDPGFKDVFEALCASCGVGRLLVTSRYPIPGADDLLRVDVPPLTRSELGRLLLRLPALRDLTGDDRRTIVNTIGGHPRLIEFADALMRGAGGRGRLTHIARRLRTLAEAQGLPLAATAARAPDATTAAQQAVLLGSRDILLDELVALLTADERETLLQAAVSRAPMSTDDLADARQTTVDSDVDRLLALTLLSGVGDGAIMVHPWVSEALRPVQGDDVVRRHEAAARMRLDRLESGRGDFDDLTETAYHLAAVGRFDELGRFAVDACDALAGSLARAAFLGEVVPMVPEDHDSIISLLDREQEALAEAGNGVAAARQASKLLDIVKHRADDEPDNMSVQTALGWATERVADRARDAGDTDRAEALYRSALSVWLRLAEQHPDEVYFKRAPSVSYNRLGDMARMAGDAVGARALYEQALSLVEALAAADPDVVGFQRDLSISYNRLGESAQAAGDTTGARALFEQSLAIRRRLAEAEPGNVEFQRDLSASFDRLGQLAESAGDTAGARDLFEQALRIDQRLAEADSTNVEFQRYLSISYDRMGQLAQAAGDTATARSLFEQALTIDRRLTEADPTNVGFQRDLSLSYNRLGQLALVAGDTPGARALFEQALGIVGRLAAADPRNVAIQRDMTVSFDWLGELAESAADSAGARAMYEQALAIRRRLAEADPSNVGIQRDLSVSFDHLGQLAQAAGDSATARGLYEQSMTISRRLAESDPGNVDFQRDLSASFERMGQLALTAGNSDRARDLFEQTLAISRRLADADPTNVEFQRNVSASLDRLGQLAQTAGDPTVARNLFEQALTIDLRLAEALPDNVDCQRDLSLSYNRLGQLARGRRDLATARDLYEKALAITRRLAEADPGNVGFQRDLSASLDRLGDLALVAGDNSTAQGLFEQALTIDQRLAQADPSNVGFQHNLAVSFDRLGQMAQTASDTARARELFEQTMGINRRLAEADPGNVGFQRDLSLSYHRLGQLAQDSGDLAGARVLFEQDLEITTRLAGADPDNPRLLQGLSAVLDRLGQIMQATGDPAAARELFERALTIDQRLTEMDPDNADFQHSLSISYRRLSQMEQAGPGHDAAPVPGPRQADTAEAQPPRRRWLPGWRQRG